MATSCCHRLLDYQDFLNQFDLPSPIDTILQSQETQNSHFIVRGATNILRIAARGKNNQLYELDIRYANNNSIFQQNLIDHDWAEQPLDSTATCQSPITKVIFYLCSAAVDLPQQPMLKILPNHYRLNHAWSSIYHFYVTLPQQHPFAIINQDDSNTELQDSANLQQNQPLITVVTVVYNGASLIEQTIQSVINQSYSHIEYIIIDGASTDSTLEIIKKYNSYVAQCISEPDGGLYEAMNKAFAKAQGEFINFINVGDLFAHSRVLESIGFHQHDRSICGINAFFSLKLEGRIYSSPNREHIPHQAFFMHRRDFSQYQFNTQFRYCADSELWYRYQPWQNLAVLSHQVVSLSRFGGISTSPKYLIPRMKEHLIFEQNFVKVIARFLPKILLTSLLTEANIEVLYFLLHAQTINMLTHQSQDPPPASLLSLHWRATPRYLSSWQMLYINFRNWYRRHLRSVRDLN